MRALVLVLALALAAGCLAKTNEPEQSLASPAAEEFSLHVDADHHVAGAERVRIHHWCRVAEGALTQCLLFDGDEPGARAIGIETILPKTDVSNFSAEELRFWHDHALEIPLVNASMPGTSDEDAANVTRSLEQTAGKVVYVWDFPREARPIGAPFAEVVPASERVQPSGSVLAP